MAPRGSSGEEEGSQAPLHGDVLEEIISHASPLDLAPASHVSKAWRCAVSSSLRRSPRRRIPWLLLHLQSHWDPSSPVLTHAYDPHSHAWIPIPRAARTPAALRSSHPGLLHSLSPSKLAFSTDAFGSTWRDLRPPRVCRQDAVVALVGSRLVVAGGGYDFEGEPLAVEVCDTDGRWEACEPMPGAFGESSSASFLSVAASDRELYVLDKRARLLCFFNPDTNRWGRTCELLPDPTFFLSAVGLAGDRLIIVGAAGGATDVESIRVWEVGREAMGLKEIGRMPPEMVGKMVGDGWGLSPSIGFSVVGDFGYLYNPSDPREMFLCELGEGSCRWVSIGSPAALDQNPMHRVVFGCSAVGMDDLKKVPRPAAP